MTDKREMLRLLKNTKRVMNIKRKAWHGDLEI